ncbi:MAG TPA: carboxypeptidase M32 [Methylomirabilota bacterium]|nr:carboxypeptidase M32 [Methylomirabilota bacterium]
MNQVSAYRSLESRFRRLAAIEGASSMLWWDQAAMMPSGGAEARAEQLAELKLVRHEMLTDPVTGDLIDSALTERLDEWQRANLFEMRRRWLNATALEPRLVETWSRATSDGEMAWRTGRAKSDFAMARAALERIVALAREIGQAKGAALGLDAYDALHDGYEPGGRAADFDPLFARLERALPPLLAAVLERQARRPQPVRPQGPFPAERQKTLGMKLMAAAGFDFEHGRLDEAPHPFCGGVADDLRLTTRYDESSFVSGLMGVMHETGHALYEQGLPAAWRNQPVAEPRGMSIHESQSLLIEMQACRSRPFIRYLAPLLRDGFGTSGPAYEDENLYRVYTWVQPGYIRVDADEVTYPLHILLRTRLERAMIAGDLKVADLPGAWNEGFLALTGLKVTEDRLGCLQDPHWYGGDFGYFPTYSMGAMTAAQLFQAAVAANPDIPEQLGQGDFRALLGWLREHVHGQGSRLSTPELLTRATGRPLDPEAFLTHLRRRYLEE